MPWTETTKMDSRFEFVTLAIEEDANMSQLCRRFGISRDTGYKWLDRFREEGKGGLIDRSRRPHRSPHKTPASIEEAACAVREAHPAWGGRKIRARLLHKAREGRLGFAAEKVPAASTITAILRRRGLLHQEDAEKSRAYKRFEKERPNQLWQMDFKGDFVLGNTARCYPLTVVDDHSRFAVALQACPNQQRETVQTHLIGAFRRYGLPERIITDHGAPWGVGMARPDGGPFYTRLSAWLMRLGIRVSFTARAHPQTNGKNERFNGTLEAEVLHFERFHDLPGCQKRFSEWRQTYNLERPHEALEMNVPASRHEVSNRCYPEELPPIEYGPSDEVRSVDCTGVIAFQGRSLKVGKAFGGQPVAVRPTTTGGVWKVYFCHQHIRTLDLRNTHR